MENIPIEKLFCENCWFIGEPSTFKRRTEHGLIRCPKCNHYSIKPAAEVDWCDRCNKRPRAEGSDKCSICEEVDAMLIWHKKIQKEIINHQPGGD